MLRLLPPNGGSLMPLLSPLMASFTMLLIGFSTDCVGTFVRLGHFPTVWSKNMPVPAFPLRVPAVSPPAFVVHAPPLQSPLTASPPGLMVLVWASTSRNSVYSHVSSPPLYPIYCRPFCSLAPALPYGPLLSFSSLNNISDLFIILYGIYRVIVVLLPPNSMKSMNKIF